MKNKRNIIITIIISVIATAAITSVSVYFALNGKSDAPSPETTNNITTTAEISSTEISTAAFEESTSESTTLREAKLQARTTNATTTTASSTTTETTTQLRQPAPFVETVSQDQETTTKINHYPNGAYFVKQTKTLHHADCVIALEEIEKGYDVYYYDDPFPTDFPAFNNISSYYTECYECHKRATPWKDTD